MTVLIGVDEAGYGPNLGPLCVGASVWRVESAGGSGQWAVAAAPDLYEVLGDSVSRTPIEGKLAIADSKQLYKPQSHTRGGAGLKHLELGVLAALLASNRHGNTNGEGTLPASVNEFVAATCADPANRRLELPWHNVSDAALPIDAAAEKIETAAGRLRDVLKQTNVQLVQLRARLVHPAQFNALVEHHGTKGAALSHVTLALVRELIDSLSADSLTAHCPLPTAYSIACDKHGGRNRYAELLDQHFPEQEIETLVEGRAESRYRWDAASGPMEIAFRTRGEAFLPAALASMTAKYHRELGMRAFNAFWRRHLPELKPTAGYPQDAKRFKAEIVEKQRELGIADQTLWRAR